jgi:hypothetical protein
MTSNIDPVEAVTEANAKGSTAVLFADIRNTLDVNVVNLIWRHLATMPGALEWVWSSLKPLYLGPAIASANHIRETLALPTLSPIPRETLIKVGLDRDALASIRGILNSYYHTNALALVCFSAFLARFEGAKTLKPGMQPKNGLASSHQAAAVRGPLPRLIPLSEMTPTVAGLVEELNNYGEDTDSMLVASMYRHLAHWPAYLDLLKIKLSPLHDTGELIAAVANTRSVGDELGARLASSIPSKEPPPETAPALLAVRRFARHPIARMTGVCSLIRSITPQ